MGGEFQFKGGLPMGLQQRLRFHPHLARETSAGFSRPKNKVSHLTKSSVGRSGSSMFGELLAQMPNTLYFFEPLMFYQKYTSEGVTPTTSLSIVRKIYSCAWSPVDARWASFNGGRNLARQNGRRPVCRFGNGTRMLSCLKKTCLENTNIVVKFQIVEKVIADDEENDNKTRV
ncbi:hypothetical protein C7M84_015442 [Penaeus vannamei]|uniref:Uncharacterized protein n=1 Tax=Penaeus vannamei TaxID=6689 RepID=A0A3R7NTT6_PENVA|nr:hypothetical protein C7M84_015442 [Penaeus vannamei]